MVMEYYLAGAWLRCSQILVDAALWIAFGCFIAAIFRHMIGPAKLRSLFGNDSRFGLLIGWAVGMLLPVCSLGVIPVVRELHRAKVKPGTIVSFGLTAPLFNPLSILYGLTCSDPIAIILFSAAAMVIVTGMGAIWGKLASQPDGDSLANEISPEVHTTGVRRSVAVVQSACYELSGWSMIYITLGVFVSATIATLFPHGSLQTETEPDKVFAPVFMAFFTTPVYSTPLLAMSQIGGMFQHGNSVGAAFSLLVLGAGINVGVLAWFASAFGFKRILLFMVMLLGFTIVLAYGLDKPLYPKGVSPSGHTHAFDIYTHPYLKSENGLLSKSIQQAKEYRIARGFGGPRLLLILFLCGIIFRLVSRFVDFEAWYSTPVENSASWDKALPSWVIGTVACACLIVVSVIGTFLYYPPPLDLLDDLSDANLNCVHAARTGDWEGVEKWVPFCDDLSRRLEVGVFLRGGKLGEFKRTKGKVYREQLDTLRDSIKDGLTHQAKDLAMDVQNAYLRLSRAYRNE